MQRLEMDVNDCPFNDRPVGTALCLISAAGYGVMALFAKLAYDEGVSVDTLLLVRFGLAGAVLLALAVGRGAFRHVRARSVLIGLAMGAAGFALQAGLYFTALTRLDASLVALILYVYPVLVMAGAIALRRERASVRRCSALVTALAGIGLVLAGAASGGFDLLGAGLALGAALTYSVYILVGDGLTADVPPLALSALVCCGAFGTFLVGGTSAARTTWTSHRPLAAAGGHRRISTVGAVLCFFAGLIRVGPSKAAILSILEPVVTVASAALVFGETLTPTQALGALLVLGAVLIVQWNRRPGRRRGASRSGPGPAGRPAGDRHRSRGRAGPVGPCLTGAAATPAREADTASTDNRDQSPDRGEHRPRCPLHVGHALGQHQPPVRGRRLRSEPRNPRAARASAMPGNRSSPCRANRPDHRRQHRGEQDARPADPQHRQGSARRAGPGPRRTARGVRGQRRPADQGHRHRRADRAGPEHRGDDQPGDDRRCGVGDLDRSRPPAAEPAPAAGRSPCRAP